MSIYTALITFFVTLKNSVTESSNSTSSEGYLPQVYFIQPNYLD